MADRFQTDFRTSLSRLEAAWELARRDWTDEAANRFESEFWVPIGDGAKEMLFALRKIDEELEEIEERLRRIS